MSRSVHYSVQNKHQKLKVLYRFREIVNRLKVMAQLLRPPPKRRPSHIASQASAGSHSIPSQPGLAADSQPASLQQNASANDLAAVAEAKGSVLSPRGNSSRTPLGSPARLGGLGVAEQKPAAAEAAEQVCDTKPEENSNPPEAPPKKQSEDETATKSKSKSSEEYVSPFEQIQEGPAAPQNVQVKTSPETQSPFADLS